MSTLDMVCQVVADQTGVPVAELPPWSSPRTIAAWDSLAQLNVILALEETFGLELTPEDADVMVDVQTIARLIDSKRAH